MAMAKFSTLMKMIDDEDKGNENDDDFRCQRPGLAKCYWLLLHS